LDSRLTNEVGTGLVRSGRTSPERAPVYIRQLIDALRCSIEDSLRWRGDRGLRIVDNVEVRKRVRIEAIQQ